MTPDTDLRSWSDDELDRTLDDLLRLGSAAPATHASRPAASHRRRWVAPVAAAAAVVGVLSVAILPGPGGSRVADEARTLAVRGDVADVGGVRFPIPDGWSVAVIAADDDSVTACLAAAPGPTCDGVQVVMAVPGGPALPISVTNNVVDGRCAGGAGTFVQVEPEIWLGGRGGVHYFGGSCTPDGPVAHAWVTDDMSVAIKTPGGRWAADGAGTVGRWAAEGATVAGGLDLATWARPAGSALLYPGAETTMASAVTTAG